MGCDCEQGKADVVKAAGGEFNLGRCNRAGNHQHSHYDDATSAQLGCEGEEAHYHDGGSCTC